MIYKEYLKLKRHYLHWCLRNLIERQEHDVINKRNLKKNLTALDKEIEKLDTPKVQPD